MKTAESLFENVGDVLGHLWAVLWSIMGGLLARLWNLFRGKKTNPSRTAQHEQQLTLRVTRHHGRV